MFEHSRSRSRAQARKRPVQARSRETVATIVEAAAHVFVQRGYAGFTTNDVAARAGVSIGSIYQYFADKDALLAGLVERDIDSAQAAVSGALARLRGVELSDPRWARTLLRAWCETHEHPYQHALYALSAALPGVRARGEAGARAIATQIAQALRRARVSRSELRARVLLLIAGGLIHELLIALPHGPQRRRAERECAAALTAYIRSVLPQERARAVAGPLQPRRG